MPPSVISNCNIVCSVIRCQLTSRSWPRGHFLCSEPGEDGEGVGMVLVLPLQSPGALGNGVSRGAFLPIKDFALVQVQLLLVIPSPWNQLGNLSSGDSKQGWEQLHHWPQCILRRETMMWKNFLANVWCRKPPATNVTCSLYTTDDFQLQELRMDSSQVPGF